MRMPSLRSESTRWLLAVILVGTLVGDGLTGVRDDQAPDTGDACTNIGPRALNVVLEVYDEDDRRAGLPR